MNAWHSFAVTLILSVAVGLLFLAIVRQSVSARWARILEAIRGVVFWSVPWIILTSYAYFLQATTLGKLTRSELITVEPWFTFIHQSIPLTTPYVMAGILTFLAAAGGFSVATHIDILLALIGLMGQGTRMSPEQKAGLIQNLVSSLIFIIAGIVMIWVDARVFSLRWIIDTSEIEKEIQGVSTVVHLICWGYFSGFILLSWILHRKYRQFLDAIGMEEEDEQREPPVRETPQQRTRARERRVVMSRQQNLDREEEISPTPWRRIPSPSNREGQGVPIPSEPDFPVIPEQFPSNGDEEAVLPEHFDPFRTRRW